MQMQILSIFGCYCRFSLKTLQIGQNSQIVDVDNQSKKLQIYNLSDPPITPSFKEDNCFRAKTLQKDCLTEEFEEGFWSEEIEESFRSEEFEEDFWNEEFEESFRALNRFFKQLQFSKMMWNYPTLSDLRCTCTHVNAVHYWIVYAYACWEV